MDYTPWGLIFTLAKRSGRKAGLHLLRKACRTGRSRAHALPSPNLRRGKQTVRGLDLWRQKREGGAVKHASDVIEGTEAKYLAGYAQVT